MPSRSRSANAANIWRTTSALVPDTGASIARIDRSRLAREGWGVQNVPAHLQLSTAIVNEPDGTVRLALGGELDMNGVVETERAVREASKLSDSALTIDLSELTF